MEQRKQRLIGDIQNIYRKLPLLSAAESNEAHHARFVLESVLAMKTAELRSLGVNWH